MFWVSNKPITTNQQGDKVNISIQVYKVNDRHPQANEYVYFQSNTGTHCYGAYNGDGTWYDWSDTDRDGEPEMYRDDNILFWHHPVSTEEFELATAQIPADMVGARQSTD